MFGVEAVLKGGELGRRQPTAETPRQGSKGSDPFQLHEELVPRTEPQLAHQRVREGDTERVPRPTDDQPRREGDVADHRKAAVLAASPGGPGWTRLADSLSIDSLHGGGGRR